MPVLPTTKNIVRIVCRTFNHAQYIKDTMDGFCIQKTNFPFVAIIIDDASTDGEPDIISHYLEEHFDMVNAQYDENDDAKRIAAVHKNNPNCHFLVVLLKYNFYSIKKAQYPLYKGWYENVPYIASCEGDDYWIDPLKLQKQVDILEANSEITMVCNRTKLYSESRKKIIGENFCYNKSQVVNPKDVIYRTGLYISTCSMTYRKGIKGKIPDYWAKCKVGDYPLQIMCAMKGKVYYLNDAMSVYRVENSNSWMGKQQWGKLDKGRLEVIASQINMFKGFAIDFPQYKTYFKNKIANHINRFIPVNRSQEEINQYIDYFHEDIEKYNLLQKIDLWMCKLKKPRIRYVYKQLFQKKYSERKMLYIN